MGLASVFAAMAGIRWGLVPGQMAGMLVGAACGAFNGLMVSVFAVPAFVATLGMLSIARGLALTLTDGAVDMPSGIAAIGWGNVGPVPIIFVIVLVVFVIGHVALELTTFGRRLYGTGANIEATRLSGVQVGRYRS